MYFEHAALVRGNRWHCAVCGSELLASDLRWDDPAVPSCPVCFTFDMLVEDCDLPPVPAEVINWF